MKTHLIRFNRIVISLLIACAIISFSSCQTYQHVSLSSDLPQDQSRQFVYENDSVIVKYAFAGENCPISIDVYNKLNKPLYVDWGQSSIIFDNQSFSLGPGATSMKDNFAQVDENQQMMVNFASGGLFNTMTSNNKINLIAPFSNITVSPMNLVNEWLPVNATDSIVKAKLSDDLGEVTVKKHVYGIDKSPLYFRCYLTYFDDSQKGVAKHIDHQFWASDICKSTYAPDSQNPSKYHVAKTTVFGNVMQGMGVLLLTIGTIFVTVVGSSGE